jgi:serine phosphatase RsbU (regulator of sigma subunit)
MEALRKHEKTKKIPVIILTAQASEDYKIQKLEEGVDDYISKPFNPRELQARVAILLKAREYERIIVDSITYAKRIQLSILPRDSILDQYMKEYFIIWKPRDIVGGDIYWFRNISDTEFILAVIDCTGHGVPGAVMTMIANSLLNRIVDDYVHDNPSQVLKNLNALMRDTLKQNIASALSDDGLDIGLCYVDTRNKTLLFSGARLSLFYFHDSTLREITGDKQSIGYKKSRDDYEYRNHEVHMKGSNMFYMATDGYYEQNSPESNLPLGREKFKELLKSCSSIPFVEQKSYLEKTLSQYQLDTPQRDDITLLGFHISL